MDRRGFLAATGAGVALASAGCALPGSGDGDPDIETESRLGAAPRVSMTVDAERDWGGSTGRTFREWVTHRAAERAADRLRTTLERESLTGEGVQVRSRRVDLADLNTPENGDRPSESEFDRAAPYGPGVFHYRHYSRDGELLSEPEVNFASLVAATPRAFEVTMAFPNETFVDVLPALCRRGAIQND